MGVWAISGPPAWVQVLTASAFLGPAIILVWLCILPCLSTESNSGKRSKFGEGGEEEDTRQDERDFVISCRINLDEDSGDRIKCTTLGGLDIGSFPVPQGEEPFGQWLSDAVVLATHGMPGRLCLVNPAGDIFWAAPRVWDKITSQKLQQQQPPQEEEAVHQTVDEERNEAVKEGEP